MHACLNSLLFGTNLSIWALFLRENPQVRCREMANSGHSEALTRLLANPSPQGFDCQFRKNRSIYIEVKMQLQLSQFSQQQPRTRSIGHEGQERASRWSSVQTLDNTSSASDLSLCTDLKCLSRCCLSLNGLEHTGHT